MKIVGLTGGIGTGKSTVSAYLKEKAIPVIDADKIAHEITEKGSPVLDSIKKLLGDEVFNSDGTLNRQAVAGIIFNDEKMLTEYQKLTTDKVIEICAEKADEYRKSESKGIAVLDAPLLFECGMEKYTDEVWLVDADIEVRLHRIYLRDGLSKEAIWDRIKNQMSAEEKAEKADFVIDNSKDLKWLYNQIDQLLERV